MRKTPLEQKIITLAQPLAQELGLEIVDVTVIGTAGSQTVQIMAENPETGNILLDQCADLSRALSVHLDVEDPIEGKYRLEVSSPGIDRPLTREKDYTTYADFEAKIERHIPDETGQKRFRGFIRGIEDGIITLDTDHGMAHIAYADVSKAKLVMTDALIKKTQKQK